MRLNTLGRRDAEVGVGARHGEEKWGQGRGLKGRGKYRRRCGAAE